MIINDFNTSRTLFGPFKTDPKLVIDSNAVLTGAVALQSFKPISGGNPQVRDLLRRIQLVKFSIRNPPE
jgi:hypothetical protein